MDDAPEIDAEPETDAAVEHVHFLSDPDVSQAFDNMLEEFARESDRGAVLIAADVVAAHLAVVLKELAPHGFAPAKLKSMFAYPGLLSSLAARADVALMAGFIDATLYESIRALRSLRNDAAHSQDKFHLKNNLTSLRRISDIGQGVTAGVNQFANEAVILPYIDHLLARGREMEVETGRNLIPDRATIIEELRQRPDTMAALQEKALRTELAFAVWLLLGAMAHRRKSLVAERQARRTSATISPAS